MNSSVEIMNIHFFKLISQKLYENFLTSFFDIRSLSVIMNSKLKNLMKFISYFILKLLRSLEQTKRKNSITKLKKN